jgi:hypothetical protein
LPEDLQLPVDGQPKILTTHTEPRDTVEAEVEIEQSIECSLSGKSLALEQEDSDAPEVNQVFTMNWVILFCSS